MLRFTCNKHKYKQYFKTIHKHLVIWCFECLGSILAKLCLVRTHNIDAFAFCSLFYLALEYYLPRDDGEFYQLCYVDSNAQVRGASTPFCFQNPTETSADCSLLVISTQVHTLRLKISKWSLIISKNFCISLFLSNVALHTLFLLPSFFFTFKFTL